MKSYTAIERACKLLALKRQTQHTREARPYGGLILPFLNPATKYYDRGGTDAWAWSTSVVDLQFIGYGVDPETETLNYDQIAELAREHKPKLLLVGASAYPRIIDFARLRQTLTCRCIPDGGYGSHCGACRRWCASNPGALLRYVTSTTHKTLRARGGRFSP